jgi:hypothetical protein
MFIVSRKGKNQQEAKRGVQNQTQALRAVESQAQPRHQPLNARDWLDLQWLAHGHLVLERPMTEMAAGLLAWRICPETERERVAVLHLATNGILTEQHHVWRLTDLGLRQICALIQHINALH